MSLLLQQGQQYAAGQQAEAIRKEKLRRTISALMASQAHPARFVGGEVGPVPPDPGQPSLMAPMSVTYPQPATYESMMAPYMPAQRQQQQQQQQMPSFNTVQQFLPESAAATPAAAPSGSGAAVSGGYPSSGAFGVGSGVGGAPGGAAAATPASAAPGMSNMWGLGGGSGMGAFATPAAYAMLIGGGKMLENKLAQDNPNHPLAKAGMGLLGPSLAQYKEDPKLLGLSAIGLPFLTPFFANEDAKKADPEFAGLWRGFGLPFG